MAPPRTTKKTVVIDLNVEPFIRKTWAMLIEAGTSASTEPTYSTALNMMLVGFITQVGQDEGLSPTVRDAMWDFVADVRTREHLDTQDLLANLGQALQRGEPPPERPGNKRGGSSRKR